MRARRAIRRVMRGQQSGLAPVVYGHYDQVVRREQYRLIRVLSRVMIQKIHRWLLEARAS